MTYIEMGNGSDSLLECIQDSVLCKLGLDFCGRRYHVEVVAQEDTQSYFEGILSVIKDGYDIVAQATIVARRPFAHASVSIMDYR